MTNRGRSRGSNNPHSPNADIIRQGSNGLRGQNEENQERGENMNGIKTFENPSFGAVRTVTVDCEPYFVGKDVAEALGYADTNKAITTHVDEDDRLNDKTALSLGQRGGWLINESGLYSLILSSKLPKAKEFKRWVTAEVLPSIRRTGSYSPDKPAAGSLREIQETNSRIRTAKAIMEFTRIETLSESQRNALISKSVEVLTGEPLTITPALPTPIPEKTYSAAEVGNRLGVSAQRIGKLAKENSMKTSEYGEWYKDKSPYSSKEVDTFRYNEKAVERFRIIIEQSRKE